MLTLLLPALLPLAHAEVPAVAWDAGNTSLSVHSTAPFARTWTWSCTDPSNEVPLTHECNVWDTTAGNVGSGNEVAVSSADCGTSAVSPSSITFAYDVPNPVGGHWYTYSAVCFDSENNRFRRNHHAVYDGAAPTATITATPPANGTNPTVDFRFTCDDDVFATDWNRYGNTYRPECRLFCKLEDGIGGTVVARRGCDVSTVSDGTTEATQQYAGLSPGDYVFKLEGMDGVNQLSAEQTYAFTILGTVDTDGDTDDTDDDTDATGSDTDTDGGSDTDGGNDTDDTTGGDTDGTPGGDTDGSGETDAVTDTDGDTDGSAEADKNGDCTCAQGTPSPGMALLVLGLVGVRRRR